MVPERFGRYQVLEQIGDGAMGRVYRARDPVVGRVVAIKTIKSEYLSREEAPEYLRRFRREAQAAGVLNHAGIVSIFDVGEDHIVMEHLEGQTLQALLKERGRLAPAEAALVLGPVAAALDHAHRQGVVHRDIKPSNIMILPDGRPKLMDFGIAHFESSVMTSTGQILGSPSYMAPEQVAGRTVTSRTDVYALGVVAYEAVTGQRPFQGSNVTTVIYKIMSEPAPPPRSLNDTLPTRYDDIFRKALAKDPAERFATAAELVVALEIKEFEAALSAAIVPEAAPESPRAESPTPPLTRRRGRAWMAAALAAAAALLAFLVARTPAPSTEGQASAPTPSPLEGGPSLDGPSTTAAPSPVPSPEERPARTFTRPSRASSPSAPVPLRAGAHAGAQLPAHGDTCSSGDGRCPRGDGARRHPSPTDLGRDRVLSRGRAAHETGRDRPSQLHRQCERRAHRAPRPEVGGQAPRRRDPRRRADLAVRARPQGRRRRERALGGRAEFRAPEIEPPHEPGDRGTI